VDFNGFTRALDEKKKVTPKGSDYWLARDIQPVLGYSTWESFSGVIEKAKIACESAGASPENHFRDTTNMVDIGSGAKRRVADCFLSRYACYLVAMNGESTKAEVGMAQTYFAVQTRRQEVFDQLTDAEKRLELRARVKDHNKYLSSAAKKAGVQNYPRFQDAGYRGLYGGLGVRQVKRRKGIPDKEDLLDRAGRAELAANDFRITQTEEQLSWVNDEESATRLHHSVGAEVRETIRKIKGIMPESLPAEPHIRTLKPKRKTKGQLPPKTEEA
jgi:DNA-damage-inducible protein D